MMKTTKLITGLICGSALLAIVGCTSTAKKPQNQLIMTQLAASKPPQNNATAETIDGGGTGGYVPGSGTFNCCGAYTGIAYITNSATGTYWFTPPAGTTNGIATDTSGFSSPYESVVRVTRKSDSAYWCGTNSVSFPVSSSTQYKFMIYTKNTPPPPTNDATLTVDVQWNP